MSVHKVYDDINAILDKIPEHKRPEYLKENLPLGILVDESTLFNPLEKIPKNFEDKLDVYLMYLLTRPEYIHSFAKYILNWNMFPEHCAVFRGMWKKKFPMLIGSRGWGKTSLMALYALCRAFMLPNRKVMIVGSSFRQSKMVFEYIEKYWENAPVLSSLCDSKSGPYRDVDGWVFRVNNSIIRAIPIGNGDKIRGYRSEDTIADEKAAINQEIFNTVIQGFSVVSSDPRGNAEKHAIKEYGKFFKNIDLSIDSLFEDGGFKQPNQLLMSGTAYYRFNHFYDEFTKYRNLIRSNGEPEKIKLLAERSGRDIQEFQIDPKNLCIFRLPIEFAPKGLMDEDTVSRAKSMTNSSTFMMEYSACFCPYTLVLTDKGMIPIHTVRLGDYVMTHRGRYRKVLKVTNRLVDQILHTSTDIGLMKSTQNHPLWQKDDEFIPAIDAECLYFPNSESVDIDLLNYIGGFLETPDNKYIYPMHATCNLPLDKQQLIRNDDRVVKDIAATYGVTVATIRRIKNNNEIPKNAIYRKVKVGYELGYLLACYLYRKQINAEGRQLSFYFKETEKEFIKTVGKYLTKVFGIDVKNYPCKPDGVRVSANSTVLVAFFKHMFENNDLWYSLLSNIDAIRGFKEGSKVARSRHANTKWQEIVDRYASITLPKENKILSKEVVDYNDLVFNLEVEEDNSYVTEFGAVHNCFPNDSTGFFKRLVIEEATCTPENIAKDGWPTGVPEFKPILKGKEGREYVMGIDPASEVDNFAIQVLEVHKNHRRLVYTFTTRRSEFKNQARGSGLSEEDFYAFCCGKIVELCKNFNIVRIGIDKMGGGVPIITGLQNTDVFGEDVIYPIVDRSKMKDTDHLNGKHILEEVIFARSEWMMSSNHNLRAHLEKKILIFPNINGADIALAMAQDYASGDERLLYDGMESCVFNIEETKNELSNIVHSNAGAREKWDTPDTIVKKQGSDQKGKMRKDRYSSLLIADYIADEWLKDTSGIEITPVVGGFVQDIHTKSKFPKTFQGNQNLGNKIEKAIRGFYS